MVTIPDIRPEDMPSFLNDLALTHFQDNADVYAKLSLCAGYITYANRIMLPNYNIQPAGSGMNTGKIVPDHLAGWKYE